MKNKFHILILLSFVALGVVSCTKEPFGPEDYYNLFTGTDASDSGSHNNGDDKKIDIKGSLTNGDMKHPNLEAWLSEKTLYVGFNDTIDNCMVLVFTSGGRVVYSRQVEEQRPGTVRIYMGNKPSDTYRLYITNGRKEAEGRFNYKP